MTDRLKALIAVRDAVKAGAPATVSAEHIYKAFGKHLQTRFWEAYSGSLDAAKTLHEAVLPGWGWDVANVGACELDCYKTGVKVEALSFIDNPARAWLLAILEALIAMEQAHD